MFQLFAHLLVKFSVEIPASDKDGYDPEQAGEEDVEGEKQEEKPPDWRHLAPMLSPGDQVVSHNHWEMLAAITSTHTGVL